MNAPRPGWISTAAAEAAERWSSVNGNGSTTAAVAVAEGAADAAPDVGSDTQDVSEPATDPADVLARDIIRTFTVGRGFQGNRTLCESESVLREWLAADGAKFDEADLPAALSMLETATLPGSTSRLLRGSSLHRSYPITSKPLPPRAMQLLDLHPMDTREYEPADIEPYLILPDGSFVHEDSPAPSSIPVLRYVE